MLKTFYQTNKAVGSEVVLTVIGNLNQSSADEIFRTLWINIFDFEKRFSRFLPASELSAFNRGAGLKLPISHQFQDLLNAAKKLGTQTAGLFNPFVLPAVQKVGYVRSMMGGHEQDAVDDHSKRTVVTIDKLEIGDGWAMIPYGTALDMGGCGKGYLADQLSLQMHGQSVAGYWFSLGGDIVAKGLDENGKALRASIENIDDPGNIIARLAVPRRQQLAVAASGTGFRRGINNGKAWHHIIDPRTQDSAQTDIIQATVWMQSALEADVLAKCAIILGSQKALPFLKAQQVYGAHLQFSVNNGGISVKKFGKLL